MPSVKYSRPRRLENFFSAQSWSTYAKAGRKSVPPPPRSSKWFDDANVPPWAMKVVLDEEEFTGAAARPASALADALAEEDDLYRELNNS